MHYNKFNLFALLMVIYRFTRIFDKSIINYITFSLFGCKVVKNGLLTFHHLAAVYVGVVKKYL